MASPRAELDPDRLAALEEERDFLLRSLEDLEAERAAGEIGAEDYDALRDEYTARAAAVLRAIEQREAALAVEAPPASRGRILLWVAGVVLVGILAGVVVAQSSGRRGAGETFTGGIRESTRQLLVDAGRAFEEGDIDAALAAYQAVLVDEPSNVEALTYRGWLLYGSGEAAEGIDLLLEAVEVDETFVDAWSFLVLALEREGRREEGLGLVQGLVAGGGADVALAVAQQLQVASQPVLALALYDAVLAEEPEQPIALAYRGWMLHLAELDDEAIGYLDRAVAADPQLPDAHVFRAVVLRDLDRLDEARAALAAFDALDPPAEMAALVENLGLREDLEP